MKKENYNYFEEFIPWNIIEQIRYWNKKEEIITIFPDEEK